MRERDGSFGPASRGTKISMSVCMGLWLNTKFSFHYVLEVIIVTNQHPSILKERSNGKAYEHLLS
jgi:hypothetical protein